MKAWLYFCSCASLGIVSFWAGAHSPSDARPDDALAKRKAEAVVGLPDASALARATREKLAALPASLWSLPAPAATSAEASDPAAAAAPPVEAVRPTIAVRPNLPEPEQFPPSQIVEALSGTISAIVRSNGEARLVIADRATTVRQVYRVGDLFRGTWRISAIQPDHVLLARKGETVRVPVAFSARASRPVEATARLNPKPESAGRAAGELAPSRRRVTRRVAVSN